MTQVLPVPVHPPPGSLLAVTAGTLPSVSGHRLPRAPCTPSSQAPVGGEVCRAGVDATPGRPEEEGCGSEACGDGSSPGGQCGWGSAGTPRGGEPMSCGWEQGPRRGHCQGGSGGSSPGFLLRVRAFVLTHSGKTPCFLSSWGPQPAGPTSGFPRRVSPHPCSFVGVVSAPPRCTHKWGVGSQHPQQLEPLLGPPAPPPPPDLPLHRDVSGGSLLGRCRARYRPDPCPGLWVPSLLSCCPRVDLHVAGLPP